MSGRILTDDYYRVNPFEVLTLIGVYCYNIDIMLPQNEMTRRIESEPVMIDSCSEQGSSFVRGMNVLCLDNPNHARSEHSPTPHNAWDLEVEIVGTDVSVPVDIARSALGDYSRLESRPRFLSFIAYGNSEITNRIDKSLAEMPSDCKPSDELVEFFKVANLGAFANRIDKNSGLDIKASGIGAEDYNVLALGTGVPSELTGIFDKHYEFLMSSELAKQTVGMRWNQTAEMDESVELAVAKWGYEKNPSEPRYYYTGGLFSVGEVDTNERAGIYVRKEEVASKVVEGGRLVVMRRDSFMVDFRHKNMRDLLPEFRKWYIESLGRESSGGDGYEHFQAIDVDEDAIVRQIRASRDKVSTNTDVRGGSGLKIPISGGQVTGAEDGFGRCVAKKIESTMSAALTTGEQYSSEFGVYPANRSYYLFYEKS